jgi:diamine N-acetyltransferase
MLKLRNLILKDSEITWQWRNQKPVKEYYSDHPFEVTHENEVDWYHKNVLTENKMTRIFGVEADGKLAGITMLKNIHPIHKLAEFAILIDEKQSGKGYGKEACYQTLSYGFSQLNLHRIFLKVRTDHPAAIRIYENCGFQREGTLRQEFFKNNLYHDQLIMGILRNEFNSR